MYFTIPILLNNNLKGFTPILDSTGKITGYKTQAGADTVFPFKGSPVTVVNNQSFTTLFLSKSSGLKISERGIKSLPLDLEDRFVPMQVCNKSILVPYLLMTFSITSHG